MLNNSKKMKIIKMKKKKKILIKTIIKLNNKI